MCSVALPHGAVGRSALCDCGIYRSYSLTFFCPGSSFLSQKQKAAITQDSFELYIPMYFYLVSDYNQRIKKISVY